MHCPDGVNLTYKDSKVVKEFVYSSPQFYFDAMGGGGGGGGVKHTVDESTGKCEEGFLADMKAAIESKDGKQDFWIDSQEAGQESSKVSFNLTACKDYGVLNAKGGATDSVSSVTMSRSLCLVLTKQQVPTHLLHRTDTPLASYRHTSCIVPTHLSCIVPTYPLLPSNPLLASCRCMRCLC
jgi:hypothetical protein